MISITQVFNFLGHTAFCKQSIKHTVKNSELTAGSAVKIWYKYSTNIQNWVRKKCPNPSQREPDSGTALILFRQPFIATEASISTCQLSLYSSIVLMDVYLKQASNKL
jgi:hypothetical protein